MAQGKRDRSPNFPCVSLKTAIDRLAAFDGYFSRHPAPLGKLGLAWALKEGSDQATQIAAALRSYGLIDYQGGSGARQAVMTNSGRNYLRAQQDSIKQEILRHAALQPAMIRKLWTLWGADRPPDPICIDELTMNHSFSDRGAPLFLKIYDETIAFAKLTDGAKIEADSVETETGDANGSPPAPQPPRQLVKVGDYVQWTNGGLDQFPTPRPINWVSDDGSHVRVLGSMTGIPTSELTLTDPPKPTPSKSAPSAYSGDDGELSVLLRGKRLEIMADVDRAGLQRLKDILTKYEEILDLIDPPSQ
jgi:hypothetical protein